MSRVGKQPITITPGVNVSLTDDTITVTGPKGTLSRSTFPNISIAQDGDVLQLSRHDEEQINRAQHGLLRTLVQNMITGVSEGFSKQLEINGVGYRVSLSGNVLKLQLGFSHDINYTVSPEVEVKVEQNIITISGIDKQLVGQIAADIRSLKKPEPYKGKGIKYVGERIIRKSGKSGKEK